MTIKLVGPRESDMHSDVANFVNCTSRSKNWGRGLSPFLLGPCQLYAGAPATFSKNVENAWQYTKVYKEHTDDNGDPSLEYRVWAKRGFLTDSGHRYPMGKGAKPLFSFWDGKKLSYIEARKAIYFPLYSEAVRKSVAYKTLCDFYKTHKDIVIWDFDTYPRNGASFDEIINNAAKPMGHGFVLEQCLLEDCGDL